MEIVVYTDGSATTADKPGGWAFVMVIDGQKVLEKSGAMENASNNDAEMEAAIQGLGAALSHRLNNPFLIRGTDPDVTLCSDSQLILGWADGTYRFKQQEPHKQAKYQSLLRLVKTLKVKTKWVKGHNGDEYNERCDKLANEARLSIVNARQIKENKEKGETNIGTKKSGVLCVWYKNCLKVIDLENNIVENYDRAIHGARGGTLEIREEKNR